jgi:signal transduction histidine kinase
MRLPETLLDSAKNGELNFLVGSGISIDAGLPDWSTILYQLSQRLPQPDQVGISRLISAGRFLEAAQLVRDRLDDRTFLEVLKKQLSGTKSPSAIAEALWDVEPVVVFTTNYDNLLESAFARRRSKTPNVIIGFESNAAKILPKETIVKLHGDLSVPESIVLSRKDYYNAIITALTGQSAAIGELIRRPCIALGYSFNDPDLQLLLHWIENEMKSFRPAIYLLSPPLAYEERCLLQSTQGITLLEYDQTKTPRSTILRFLQSLAAFHLRGTAYANQATARLALLESTLMHVGAIRHDLNNYLAAVQGNWQLLTILLQEADKAGVEKCLKHGLEAISDCIDTTNEMHDMARSASERLTPTKWSECRSRLVSDLDRPLYSRIKRRISGKSSAILPLGPNLLSRLVRILLDNAIEASTRTGSPPTLDIRFAMNSARLSFLAIVTDSGSGISNDMLPRLFTPGATTKGQGRGQGLFLSKAIAEEAGGDVSISSTFRKGTIAILSLPAVPLEKLGKLKRTYAPAAKLSARRGGLRILAVEDEPTVLELMTRALRSAGWLPKAFESPRAAMRYLRSTRSTPDCLVTDIIMPEMSGYDLADAARIIMPNVPIVFISGYISQGTSHRLPLASFIEKPFSAKELIDSIRSLVPD